MVACGTVNTDELRNALVQRMRNVQEALPDSLKAHCELGFMHIEHENLNRNYANTQTLLLHEPIHSIERQHFYVTEDNWAWDVPELAQAIEANGGVMRNPMTGDMFTTKDIHNLIMHPDGKHLAALQIAQQDLLQGVRPETITRMEKLAGIMVAQRSQNWSESWEQIGAFQAYVATCKS